MSETERLKALLRGYRFLNDGAGPVVPKWMARKLRQLGITEGFVEQKPLPRTETGNTTSKRETR